MSTTRPRPRPLFRSLSLAALAAALACHSGGPLDPTGDGPVEPDPQGGPGPDAQEAAPALDPHPAAAIGLSVSVAGEMGLEPFDPNAPRTSNADPGAEDASIDSDETFLGMAPSESPATAEAAPAPQLAPNAPIGVGGGGGGALGGSDEGVELSLGEPLFDSATEADGAALANSDAFFLGSDGEELNESLRRLEVGAVDELELAAGFEALSVEQRLLSEPSGGAELAQLGYLGAPMRVLDERQAGGERGREQLAGRASARGGLDLHNAPGQSQAGQQDDRAGAAMAGEQSAQDSAEAEQPWQSSRAGTHATRLRVGDEDELPLIGMQVSVWVEGFRARVLLDCMYHNDRAQQLEGDFRLKLPEGASPYYLAFGGSSEGEGFEPAIPRFQDDVDVLREWTGEAAALADERAALWNEPKEARMVPRERAAFAYQSTVRRRVDPALLEWNGAGVFSARVYPLMPGSQARVLLGYELDLVRDGDVLEYALDLPAEIGELSVDLFVAAPEGAQPRVTPQASPWSDGARTHYHYPRTGERSFGVRLDAPRGSALGMSSPTSVDEDWFATRFVPPLGDAQSAGARQAVFALDTSLSARDSLEQRLQLLQAILAENEAELSRFAVLLFDVEQRWWRTGFTNNGPAERARLASELEGLWPEGATDLEAALVEASAPTRASLAGAPWDLFLLSDAASTWGDADRHALSRALARGNAGRLFAYTDGSGADRAALDLLARESGGAVFALGQRGELAQTATAHRSAPWKLEEVRLAGARDLLLAGRPSSLYPGQELVLVGRGRPRAGQSIELLVSQAGLSRTLRVPLSAVVESELATRAYGAVAVGQLEELGAAESELATAYARHFRIPGDSCSLLMLETEEDYQRFEIVPENDALSVRSKEAGRSVEQALAQLGERLGDPHRALVDWIAGLDQMPGFQWTAPEGFLETLEGLDAADVTLARTPLTSASRDGADLSDSLRQGLLDGAPLYDELLAAAEARSAERGAADALRLFSSLVELFPGDGVAVRDVGYVAMSWGLWDHAYHLFRRVSKARPFEPQSYHAMARCLEEAGKVELAQVWYEVALAGSWPGQFGHFRRICGLDYLRLLRRIDAGALESRLGSWSRTRLPQIAAEFTPVEADVLVMITWNTDRTDIDLHVLEPTGERCYYGHKETAIGGELTQDVTQGYGPEMYVLESAVNGPYRIMAHYFSGDANRTGVRTKVYARVYLGWGTEHEEVRDVVVPLVQRGQFHDLALVDCNK